MASLYTEGGQFTYKDGRDYIGFYHLMPDGTPMTGAQHGINDEVLFFVNNVDIDNIVVTEIPPNFLGNQGNAFKNNSFTEELIPSTFKSEEFDPELNVIELFIYDTNRNVIGSNGDLKSYRISEELVTPNNFSQILLDPANDMVNGINNPVGTYFSFYNFLEYELSSSAADLYFISEISPDRTEIRLQSNVLSNDEISNSLISFKEKLDSSDFFDEFYIKNLDRYYTGVNILLDTESEPFTILVKLFEPLPSDVNTKLSVSIITKVAETKAYQVTFPPQDTGVIPKNFIKGPNTNIKVKDRVNNSTDFKTKNNLKSTTVSSAVDQLEYFTSQSGIELNPSYSVSVYDDFVHFSSAEQRLRNFFSKVQNIESFQTQINLLDNVNDTNSTEVSSSKLTLEKNIKELITTFDGFEYFLYFESGSQSYPKSTTTYPFTLQSSTSTEVRTWLGSTDEDNIYYGGALLSASLYDEDNVNNLLYVIPEYIRSNPENSNYILFSNMVGQFFDETWLYTKAVTNKLNSTNQLDKGADLSLIDDVLRSFGQEIYGSNFNNIDDYSSLIGVSSEGSILPATGSEVITNFVTASNEVTPLKRVNQEIHKRLYHNLVTLYKKKGTKAGLRQLINLYGIPDTILRIYEFGGKDKINQNDWDLYRNIFNKEITSHQTDADRGKEYNGGVETPWKVNPLWASSATIAGVTGSVPATVEFRFKSDINPATTPSQSIPLQPLWGLKDNNGDTKVLVYLEYNGSGSASGSYSGSILDPNLQNANLTLAVSGSPPTSASVSLPFYNQDWWNVRVQMQETGLPDNRQARYSVASANKIYNGKDGTQIGYKGSIKLDQISGSWVDSISSSFALSRSFNSKQYINFSGSLQELRYWALCFENQNTPFINEDVWDNHVMDPLSIETGYLTGSMSPVEHLIFRSREGEDLALISGSQSRLSQLESIHPKITGSLTTTSSFANDSLYNLVTASINNNIETQFLNQPNLGIKNRVSDKIKIYNNLAFGNLLSPYRSIQQNYEASQSFTEDINLLQVAFSPQDEVNDDITHEFGFSNKITDLIADPRNLSSSLDYYDGLRRLANKFFEKYIKGNSNDYYRLIKYFDNALFKAIKDYVPARTSLSTGIVVKQHLLERNRVRPPQANHNTTIAKTSEGGFNTDINFQNISVSGTVKSQPRKYTTGSSIEVVTGGTGGSFEKFNSLHFHPYGVSGSGPTERFGFDITQSFIETVTTLSGSVNTVISNQDEFYNGEFHGANIIITTQSLNPDCTKFLNINIKGSGEGGTLDHEFDRFVYHPTTCSLARFENDNTAPRSGEIFFFSNPTRNRFEKIKISNTSRAGEDLSPILPSLNNITFDFQGNNKNANVSFAGGGSDFTEFDIISPLFNYDSDNFTSNFINYSASANKTSSLTDERVSTPVSCSFTHFIYTIPIDNYDTETDPSNLFNLTSGVYTSPLTNNKILSITGSVSGSYTFKNDDGQRGVTYNFRLKLINTTQGDVLAQQGFSVGLSAGSTQTQQFNYTLKRQLLSTQALVTGDQVRLQADIEMLDRKTLVIGTGSLSISSSAFTVNQRPITDPNPTSSILGIEPAYLIAGNDNFDNAIDCQPLLNNATEGVNSSLYQDVDYSTGLLTPTNIVPITQNNATPAQTPDSNYSQQSRVLLRYEGSELRSLDINAFNGPGALLKDGTIYPGDISFGKIPVISRTKPFFSYFQLLVPTSPELEDATQVKLAYLIDAEGNAFKPLLNSPAFFNVEGTFESGDQIDIALEDTLQTDDASLVNAAVGINLDNFNTSADVIYGARRVDPILTSQRVSVNDVSNISDAFEDIITFSSSLGETNNFYFFAPTDGNSITYQTQVNHTLLGYSTFTIQDPSSGFTVGTGTYTFPSPGPVPGNNISFEIRGEFKIDSINQSLSNLPIVTAFNNTPQAKIQIIRERSSVETILAEEILNYTFALHPGATPPFVTEFQQVNLISNAAEMRVGDKVFARLVILNPNTFTVANASRALIGIPTTYPETNISPDFFRTGSNYTNFITASVSFTQFSNLAPQVPYINSTFKPINENFSFKLGDELRFEGSEALSFMIYDIDLVTEGNASGSFLLNVQPEVPPAINLNQFLLRRYNRDGTSVLIDLVPPSSSFATTKGVMKNTLITEKLGENIDTIISDLVKEGVLTNK